MFYLLILFVVVLILLVLPMRKTKQVVDEKTMFISIYRQELAKLSAKNYPVAQFNELKNELDEQFAQQINLLESHTFSTKKTPIAIAIFALILIFISLLYYIFHYKNQVRSWDYFNYQYKSQINDGLFDNTKLQKIVDDIFNDKTETKFSDDMRIDYCFSLQKQILSHYANDSKKLAILAECQLNIGYVGLAVDAVHRALKYDANNPDLNFLLAQAISRQNGSLNAEARDALRKTLAVDPYNKQALLLSAVDAFQNGYWELSKELFTKFKLIDKGDNGDIAKIVDDAIAKIDVNIKQQQQKQSTDNSLVSFKVSIKFDKDFVKDEAAKIGDSWAETKPLFIIVRSDTKQIVLIKKLDINNITDEIQTIFTNADKDLMQMNDINNFKNVSISARLSLTMDPKPQSGDLTSDVKNIEVAKLKGKDSQQIDLVIDRAIP